MLIPKSNVTWERSKNLPAIGTAVVHAHRARVKLAICTVIIICSGSASDGLFTLAVRCTWSGTLSQWLYVVPVAEDVAVAPLVLLIHGGVRAAKV